MWEIISCLMGDVMGVMCCVICYESIEEKEVPKLKFSTLMGFERRERKREEATLEGEKKDGNKWVGKERKIERWDKIKKWNDEENLYVHEMSHHQSQLIS